MTHLENSDIVIDVNTYIRITLALLLMFIRFELV